MSMPRETFIVLQLKQGGGGGGLGTNPRGGAGRESREVHFGTLFDLGYSPRSLAIFIIGINRDFFEKFFPKACWEFLQQLDLLLK